MGRRYLTADYARVVERARAAIPGVAIHADVIAGFPTEDEASWERSLAFIRSLDLAGLHVFRYSARPGTAAVRMTGQVDEPTKKRRAGELLALAAEARRRWARRRIGTPARALLEERLPDGRWVGHAEDHTLVAVAPPLAAAADLENAIATVALERLDPARPDRVVGRVLDVSPPSVAPAEVPVHA
jgi:threonylcarbamoyladenosine tRNA methylthiotransferase MtaB